jgi:hypothetical protein
LLDTNPNLPISAEKRRQVQDFRASQQLIQVFASQNKLNAQQVTMLQQLAPVLPSEQFN